jgi:hypothetical protein
MSTLNQVILEELRVTLDMESQLNKKNKKDYKLNY